MKRIVTTAIVLSRIDFGEADRILTVLTPDNGKVRLMAKGVRKVKSKLAGGIELFGTNEITFIPGRGEISTLVSSRLEKHYGNIIKDIDRTMFGYELLKTVNRVTEDAVDDDYFELLRDALEALDDRTVPLEHIQLWLHMQLLKLAGHSPNLKTDKSGEKLSEQETYTFSLEDMTFVTQQQGRYLAGHIKLLRLAIGLQSPKSLTKVQAMDAVLPDCVQLSRTMTQQFVRA